MNNVLSAVLVLGVLGAVFGALLAVASKVFHVEQDERIDRILAVLPGANCGGCGFPGCAGCSAAIVEGKAPVSACPVGGAPVAAQVAEIMGVEAAPPERKVAHVACRGGDHAQRRFDYDGIADCVAASKVAGGSLGCAFGCLGYGSCVAACKYGAMQIKDGVAVVDARRCVACGKCIEACPRKLISLVSEKQSVFISCNSTQKGAETRKLCSVGCIGCGLCAKKCPSEAISVVDNLARIDYSKCVNCGTCVGVCPQKLIVQTNGRVVIDETQQN